MTEVVASVKKARNVDIDSAIDHSSFQVPVFVALSAEGGEAQVIKTFGTARDVFEHVFSVMLDRLRQRRAVEKVENLVPASAHLKNSENTEYVLFVRGRAIFWFSSAAAKRSAGRRLLMEHARALADAEQAPFYVLSTRARKIRAATIALSLVVATVIAVLAYQLSVFHEFPFQRPVAQQALPSWNSSSYVNDWRFSASYVAKDTPRNAREPITDFNRAVGDALPDEAFPVPAIGPDIPSHRTLSTSAWLRGATRTTKNANNRRTQKPTGQLPRTRFPEGIPVEPISPTGQIIVAAPPPRRGQAGAVPAPSVSLGPAPSTLPITRVKIPVR